MLTEKPRPDGLALAFQERKPGQSRHEAVNMARPGLAYLGSAWPGSRPQAGPCTALGVTEYTNGMTFTRQVYEICLITGVTKYANGMDFRCFQGGFFLPRELHSGEVKTKIK